MEARISHTALVVVDNLVLDRPEIELSPETKLIRLDSIQDERLTALMEYHNEALVEESQKRGYRNAPTSPPVCAIVYQYEKTLEELKGDYPFNTAAQSKFDAVIEVLHAIKNAYFACFSTHEFLFGWSNLPLFASIAKWGADPLYMVSDTEPRYMPINHGQPLYEITQSEINFMRALIDVREKETSILYVVLKRLARQSKQYDFADRFIDVMVALEGLYLAGLIGELRYRLALRVATHFGDDLSVKQKIFDLIQLGYDIRSKIAHGEVFTITEVEKKFSKELKEYGGSAETVLANLLATLRAGFQEILLDVGETKFRDKTFHNALDNAILTGKIFDISDL